jgi:hypothetical protein
LTSPILFDQARSLSRRAGATRADDGTTRLRMNDALNSQRHTQAAWWNRILIAAKWLMVVIAIYCNGLIGYGSDMQRRQ